MPNLDQLASEGMRYDHAYAVSPVCAPSRSAIITGCFPTAIGTMHMRSHAVLPEEIRCFPEYLRAAGYYCSNFFTDYQFQTPVIWLPILPIRPICCACAQRWMHGRPMWVIWASYQPSVFALITGDPDTGGRSWRLYTTPLDLPPGTTLWIRAHRIGFCASHDCQVILPE
jgi:hypothetical protein